VHNTKYKKKSILTKLCGNVETVYVSLSMQTTLHSRWVSTNIAADKSNKYLENEWPFQFNFSMKEHM
jgi:hypothetical protein